LQRILLAWLLVLVCMALPNVALSFEGANVGEQAGLGSGSQKPAPNGKTQPPPNPVARWLELQSASLLTRYRYIDTSTGVVTSNQQQHQESFRGRLKFDSRGRYALNAGLATGAAFTSGWNNTGWGMGEGSAMVYLKQLFLSAASVKGLELQFGGLALLRGENTEITSYDNDGYIAGERLTLKRSKELFFDEISVTYAYLGDLQTPGINKRFRRLDESNYHQFLVSKKLGERASVSFDYTFQSGVETLRQGLRVATKELRIVDWIRFENYQRVDYRPDYGYALYAEKALHKKVAAGGGFADIDSNYGVLNADRFLRGRHLYGTISWTLLPELSVSAYLIQAVKNDFDVSNNTRLEFILTYNLFRSLQRSSGIKRAVLPQ
jgi:hypothetical protein